MKINSNTKCSHTLKHRWRWRFLIALEIAFSVMLIWLISYFSLYIAYVKYDVNTALKYPIYFQVFFALFLCLFIPTLFFVSFGNQQRFAKCCFLVVGIVCIISGCSIFATHAVLTNTSLHKGMVNLTMSSFVDLLPFVLLPNMGGGYILRFWCMKRYHSASYFIMLAANERRGYIRFTCYFLWWCIYFYVFLMFAK